MENDHHAPRLMKEEGTERDLNQEDSSPYNVQVYPIARANKVIQKDKYCLSDPSHGTANRGSSVIFYQDPPLCFTLQFPTSLTSLADSSPCLRCSYVDIYIQNVSCASVYLLTFSSLKRFPCFIHACFLHDARLSF
jgi:hypothetical protein